MILFDLVAPLCIVVAATVVNGLSPVANLYHKLFPSSYPSIAARQNKVQYSSHPINKLSAHRRVVVEALWKAPAIVAGGTIMSWIDLKPMPSFAAYIDPTIDPPTVTKHAYLDITFDTAKGVPTTERLVIGLYGNIMPKTVNNFVALCASNAYAGTTFYRILSDLSIQGGAIGDPTGKTGRSSLKDGQSFVVDNYDIMHTKAGLVSMVQGDSRFFINCNDNGGWGDDRYAVFGIVEKGLDVVKKIERVPVQPPKNSPKSPVTIVASGVL